jgi:hypothetical protein
MSSVRLAGIATLAGSGCAILGSFLPWITAADPSTGTTLTKAGVDGHYAMLVDLLAVIGAGIAGLLLLRGQAPTAPAVMLTTLALAQLGLVIFVGTNLSRGVAQLEAAGATAGLGSGLYLTAFGAFLALAGGAYLLSARRPPEPWATS